HGRLSRSGGAGLGDSGQRRAGRCALVHACRVARLSTAPAALAVDLLPPDHHLAARPLTRPATRGAWLNDRLPRKLTHMCLLLLPWRGLPVPGLTSGAIRAAFHERPPLPLAKWPAPNDILAGQDLRAGGTWLGLDRRHRFGAVTNFRGLQSPRRSAPSRGALV